MTECNQGSFFFYQYIISVGKFVPICATYCTRMSAEKSTHYKFMPINVGSWAKGQRQKKGAHSWWIDCPLRGGHNEGKKKVSDVNRLHSRRWTVGGEKKVSEVNRLPTQRWEVGGEKSTVSDVNRLPSQRWTVWGKKRYQRLIDYPIRSGQEWGGGQSEEKKKVSES